MSKLTRAEKKVINRNKHRRMAMARHSRVKTRKSTRKVKRRTSVLAKRTKRSSTIQGRRRHYKLYRKAGSKATRSHIITAVRDYGVRGPASLKRWIRSKGRRNPGVKQLRDGGMLSSSRSGGCVYVTLTSPHGEVYEYETTGAKATKLASAKTFASAKRVLGGSMLRSINPRRKSAARKTKAKRTSKRRSTRGVKRSARTGRFVRR